MPETTEVATSIYSNGKICRFITNISFTLIALAKSGLDGVDRERNRRQREHLIPSGEDLISTLTNGFITTPMRDRLSRQSIIKKFPHMCALRFLKSLKQKRNNDQNGLGKC